MFRRGTYTHWALRIMLALVVAINIIEQDWPSVGLSLLLLGLLLWEDLNWDPYS